MSDVPVGIKCGKHKQKLINQMRCTLRRKRLSFLQASYTPLIPLLSELLNEREVKGWQMPMWNMADVAAHQRLLEDAGFSSIQVHVV